MQASASSRENPHMADLLLTILAQEVDSDAGSAIDMLLGLGVVAFIAYVVWSFFRGRHEGKQE